ncbi:hypothetical protein ACFLZP_02780 [Patescibacteria group bacterium]
MKNWKRLFSVENLLSLANNHNGILIVVIVGIIFVMTRLMYYQFPLMHPDYGNHLLIIRYLRKGYLPYKEFSLTHMPGLYVLMFFGTLVFGSTLGSLLVYLVVVSLVFPLFFTYLKNAFSSSLLASLGIILLLTDALFTIYTKVATFDCLALVFILPVLIICQQKKISKHDYFLLTGLFFISLFIKITTVYFFGFYFGSQIFFAIFQRKSFQEKLKASCLLLVTVSVVFLGLNWLWPEIFTDIFESHLLRPAMPLSERLINIWRVFFVSPIILLGLLSSIIFCFFPPKDKRIRFLPIFFLFFLLFSVFIPRNFYQHHLIFLLPIGVELVILLTLRLGGFILRRSHFWKVLISVLGAVALVSHFTKWVIFLSVDNHGVKRIYSQVKEKEGQLYASSNFHYIAVGKEPSFEYFATIPDGPCRWGKSCDEHKKNLAKADYALIDNWVYRHIGDENFHKYLYENFYLEEYDRFSGLKFYMRR